MALGGACLTKIRALVMECAEQDQTARKCRLILICTLHKINAWTKMGGHKD